MITTIPINRKYILQIGFWSTLLVIFIDFVFLNLGIDGLLDWRLHLTTALYCFSITGVNIMFFDALNTKLDENLDANKRILIGLIGSVSVTLPTIFLCRFIHLGLISQTSTISSFIENERPLNYLFPLLIALIITLFMHAILLLREYQHNKKEIQTAKYLKNITLSRVEASKTNGYEKQLIQLFSEDKCYQNPNLDLLILSRKLGLSRRETSSVIQKVYKKQFSECVNDFRLEDVLQRFKNQKHRQYTIMALATEAGFSSKSTFYRYFKRKMGLSPSEFLEQNSLPKPNN